MSEYRLPDAIWRFRIAGREGKKTVKIELFRAAQWRRLWRPYKRNMYPKPPIHNETYWKDRYRIRVNGKWYGKCGYKYRFSTIDQALKLARIATEGQF